MLQRPLVLAAAGRSLKVWYLDNYSSGGSALHTSMEFGAKIVSVYWHAPSINAANAPITPASSSNQTAVPSTPIHDIGRNVFFVCAADDTVRVCSINEGEVVQVLRGHDSALRYIYRNDWCLASGTVVTQTVDSDDPVLHQPCHPHAFYAPESHRSSAPTTCGPSPAARSSARWHPG